MSGLLFGLKQHPAEGGPPVSSEAMLSIHGPEPDPLTGFQLDHAVTSGPPVAVGAQAAHHLVVHHDVQRRLLVVVEVVGTGGGQEAVGSGHWAGEDACRAVVAVAEVGGDVVADQGGGRLRSDGRLQLGVESDQLAGWVCHGNRVGIGHP